MLQSKYPSYVEDGANKTAVRFRRAAMKAKQKEELENLRKMMEKQIEQSLNELKLNQELELMKKTEEKVWVPGDDIRWSPSGMGSLCCKLGSLWYELPTCVVNWGPWGVEILLSLYLQNIKFIAALVDKGKLKEEELESVLKFLFPSK